MIMFAANNNRQCSRSSPTVLNESDSNLCGRPASHSARSLPPQYTTFVFATFLNFTLRKFASGPPRGEVPNAPREVIFFAFLYIHMCINLANCNRYHNLCLGTEYYVTAHMYSISTVVQYIRIYGCIQVHSNATGL